MATEPFWSVDLPEIVNMLASIVTAATAVCMAFLAWKTFLRPPEQVSEQKPESAARPDGAKKADVEAMAELVVFQTSRQTTRLVPSTRGLECHLDDERAGRGGHQWSIGPQALRQILSSGSYHVYPGNRTDSGKFTIGRRRNWLYSQRLFPEADMLQDALRDVIEAAIAKSGPAMGAAD